MKEFLVILGAGFLAGFVAGVLLYSWAFTTIP